MDPWGSEATSFPPSSRDSGFGGARPRPPRSVRRPRSPSGPKPGPRAPHLGGHGGRLHPPARPDCGPSRGGPARPGLASSSSSTGSGGEGSGDGSGTGPGAAAALFLVPLGPRPAPSSRLRAAGSRRSRLGYSGRCSSWNSRRAAPGPCAAGGSAPRPSARPGPARPGPRPLFRLSGRGEDPEGHPPTVRLRSRDLGVLDARDRDAHPAPWPSGDGGAAAPQDYPASSSSSWVGLDLENRYFVFLL